MILRRRTCVACAVTENARRWCGRGAHGLSSSGAYFFYGRSATNRLSIEECVVGGGACVPVADPGHVALCNSALSACSRRARRRNVLKAVRPGKRRCRVRSTIARRNRAIDAQRSVNSVVERRLRRAMAAPRSRSTRCDAAPRVRGFKPMEKSRGKEVRAQRVARRCGGERG